MAQQGAVQIYIHHVAPIFFRHFRPAHNRCDASVVHENIDPLELSNGPLDHRLDLAAVSRRRWLPRWHQY